MIAMGVKKVGARGKVLLPKKWIEESGFSDEVECEIFKVDEAIHIRRYCPRCNFCDESENLIEFKKKLICQECLLNLTK